MAAAPLNMSEKASSINSLTASRKTSFESNFGDDTKAVVNSVSHNTSSGNAVQINGHVAGRVYHFSSKNLTVNFQCHLSQDRLRQKNGRSCSPSVSQRKATWREIPVESIITTLNYDTENTDTQAQYLNFLSRLSGSNVIVRAIYRPDISVNFLARRITVRLELELHEDLSAIQTVRWGPGHVSSSSTFVEIACMPKLGAGANSCRFYVIKENSFPFDMLVGGRRRS